MLCHLCEPFLTDLLNQDFGNWRRVEPGWYTYKHGNDIAIKAAAEAGCEICVLFNQVRTKQIRGYEDLSEKWLVQASSIDYKYEYDRQQARAKSGEQSSEGRAKWTFWLLTVLPEMTRLPFEIFDPNPPSEAVVDEVRHSQWPHAVSLSAIAPTATRVAESWLHECLTSHSHCNTQARAPLPTRVLDIQPTDGSFDIGVQSNKGQQGQYVTLSHCWGSKSRLTLTKRNLFDLQQKVPFEQLPPTFADAVRVTASMGQRYLWIDALCILQDDQDDWRREAASMCSVFENALFSISALSAEDSHNGIIQERQTAQTVITVADVTIGIRDRFPSFDEALQKSKLETRAWCLQERLLAPRILHIAPAQLHWECRTYVMSETSPSERLKNDSGKAIRPFTATGRPAALEKQNDDHHGHWLNLVAAYSGRNLTKASDRLPAISGLAEKAKNQLGLGTYVYGLWLDNLHPGLLWRRKPRGRSANAAADAAAPEGLAMNSSWSWASSIGTIEYPLLEGSFEHGPTKADLTLKNRRSDDARDAAAFRPGTLSFIGRIKRGSCKAPAKPSVLNEAIFKSSGSLLSAEGLPCFLDDVDETLSRGCYCLFVGTFVQAPKPKQKGKREQRSCYLILERVQGDGLHDDTVGNETFGSFRRIGMGFDSPQMTEKVFANAERRRFELH